MVSLLERHKLKRRANCVSFVCNRGIYRGGVKPKQKRYFSFNTDNMDEEQSKRKLKRQKAEEIKKAQEDRHFKKDKRFDIDMKTVDVFTVTGTDYRKMDARLLSTKPEYRLEVFYHCPKSCSLNFNPKYTDVVMRENEKGQMEIRSNVKAGKKSQRRQRKRFGKKDLHEMLSDEVSFDVDAMWQEDPFDAENEFGDHASGDTIVNSNAMISHENNSRFSQNIIQSLIMEAEKTKALCGNMKCRQRTKSSKKVRNYDEDTPVRSHTIYYQNMRQNTEQKLTVANRAESIGTSYSELSSATTVLSVDEVRPSELRVKFGRMYAEAQCVPRRFVIDVTDDVRNLLSSSKSHTHSSSFTSYVVFTHDGIYDKGFSSYRVVFNSGICKSSRKAVASVKFEPSSLDDTMNCIFGALLDLHEEGDLMLTEDLITANITQRYNILHECMTVKAESFHTFSFMSNLADTYAEQDDKGFTAQQEDLAHDLDFGLFCEMCYENINPTDFDAMQSTQLTKCNHIYCNDCWRSHLRTNSKNGWARMTCPRYDCDTAVGPVTLMSLLHVQELRQLIQKAVEEDVESSPLSKWCPNPSCGRVIRVDVGANNFESATPLVLNVACLCGQSFCFSCNGTPHWPASCAQAEIYSGRFSTIKLPKENDDEDDMKTVNQSHSSEECGVVEIEGRLCPKCHCFIERAGGGPQMVCRCGHEFCWNCMKPTAKCAFPSQCFANRFQLMAHSRRVRVHHVDPSLPELQKLNLDGDQETKDLSKPSSHQKPTMYQRALLQRVEASNFNSTNQRKELVSKILCIALRNSDFREDLLTICGVNKEPVSTPPTAIDPKPHVIKFLRSCDDLKHSLHQVAEFTYVFLQDVPNCVDRRRVVKLTNDFSGYCSFIRSILECGQHQDVKVAVKRLHDIQIWAKRAITALLATVERLR